MRSTFAVSAIRGLPTPGNACGFRSPAVLIERLLDIPPILPGTVERVRLASASPAALYVQLTFADTTRDHLAIMTVAKGP
jgi:hypothetical protein